MLCHKHCWYVILLPSNFLDLRNWSLSEGPIALRLLRFGYRLDLHITLHRTNVFPINILSIANEVRSLLSEDIALFKAVKLNFCDGQLKLPTFWSHATNSLVVFQIYPW